MGKVLVIVLIAAAGVGLLLWSQHRHERLNVSGLIEADEIRVGSRVGGRVEKVSAFEGQVVHAGDVLVQLSPFDLLERRAQGKAEVAELEARLTELKNGPRPQEIAAGEARLKFADAEVELAKSTYNRTKMTFEHNAISAEEMDRADRELKTANANEVQRQAELDLLKAGTRPEQISQAQASLDAARANVSAIDKEVEELAIKAPSEARVESLDLQPGDMAAPNAPALSLTALGNLWVRAYVPENHLNVANGQKTTVTVDSFPNRKFAGHVSFIARQAEFTPNNVQTVEERSKQVFRIKVTLDEGLDVLRPGMAADVWLE